jgi:hypothetical protein
MIETIAAPIATMTGATTATIAVMNGANATETAETETTTGTAKGIGPPALERERSE